MKKLMLLGVLASVGCGPSVKRIAMEPAAQNLNSKGATVTVRASPKDDADKPVADVQLTWSSTDAAVASVDGAGKVTANKSGKAVITAKAGDVSGTTQINVSIPASITLGPPEVKLAGVGQTAMLQRAIKDDTGAVVNQPAVFTSSDPNVASVDNNGNVRAVNAGTATVTAKTGGLSAMVKVTVALPTFDKLEVKPKGPLKVKTGKTEHLTASAMAAGKDVPGIPFKWASDHADIATVSPTGDVAGVKKGKATVTVSAGDKTEKIAVTVQ
jgi:uncharacterized protein YjdB